MLPCSSCPAAAQLKPQPAALRASKLVAAHRAPPPSLHPCPAASCHRRLDVGFNMMVSSAAASARPSPAAAAAASHTHTVLWFTSYSPLDSLFFIHLTIVLRTPFSRRKSAGFGHSYIANLSRTHMQNEHAEQQGARTMPLWYEKHAALKCAPVPYLHQPMIPMFSPISCRAASHVAASPTLLETLLPLLFFIKQL